MRPLKISSTELVNRVRECVDEIHSRDAIRLEAEDNVVIVDLRDIRERERDGFIPNSIHAPRGMIEFWIDPESPY